MNKVRDTKWRDGFGSKTCLAAIVLACAACGATAEGAEGGDHIAPESDGPEGFDQVKAGSCLVERSDISATVDLGVGAVAPIDPQDEDSCASYCEAGAYAYGIQLKSQEYQGTGDDRAVTGIRLKCKDRETGDSEWITNQTVGGGSWVSPAVSTPSLEHPLVGGVVKYDASGADLKGVTNMRVIYPDAGDVVTLQPPVQPGTTWGNWYYNGPYEWFCPMDSAVCGFQNSVQRDFQTDKVGVDEVHLKCCYYPW